MLFSVSFLNEFVMKEVGTRTGGTSSFLNLHSTFGLLFYYFPLLIYDMNSVDTSSHVWLDLVDSQHPDFTTVAQLNPTATADTATAVEGEGELVLFLCVSRVYLKDADPFSLIWCVKESSQDVLQLCLNVCFRILP